MKLTKRTFEFKSNIITRIKFYKCKSKKDTGFIFTTIHKYIKSYLEVSNLTYLMKTH